MKNDSGDVELTVTLGDKSVGGAKLEHAPEMALEAPFSADDLFPPTCGAEEGARVEVEAWTDATGAWILLRCKSDSRSDRVVLRHDVDKRKTEEVHDAWRWNPEVSEGCGSCGYGIDLVFRRRRLGDSHALVFRDETVESDSGSHCDAQCNAVCDEGDAACLTRCEQGAKQAAAKLDASCKMKLKLRRWELVQQGNEQSKAARIALWPRQRR